VPARANSLAGDPVLELRDASFTAGTRQLVSQVSVSVAPGSLVCVLGPNGAGKSTCLRLLSGDLAPQRGQALLDGRPIAGWSARALARRRAVLRQDTAVAFDFLGIEVVIAGRYPHCGGRPGAADREIAERALRDADAGHLASRTIHTLSGGERARVHFARVLAQVAYEPPDPPRYLLLDEPTASLDLAHQHAVMRLARRLATERGLGVLAVVHDLNLAARYADRVLMLRDGRALAQGTPEDVLVPDTVSRCFGVRTASMSVPGEDRPALVVLA
jgi:iron complex transport system ATP-binding protein